MNLVTFFNSRTSFHNIIQCASSRWHTLKEAYRIQIFQIIFHLLKLFGQLALWQNLCHFKNGSQFSFNIYGILLPYAASAC